MNQNSQDVKKFFHGYARGFDAIYGHTDTRSTVGKLIDKYLRRTMFLRFREVLKETAKPSIQSVVDVGCGPGRYVYELLEQGKEVLALDLAQGMLDIAGQVAAQSSNKGKVRFLLGDYMDLKLDKKYDAAILTGFFDYIEKPVPLLLKLKQEVSKEIYASFPQSGGFLAWQRRIRYRQRNCPLYLYSKNDVEKLMKEAGFSNYTIQDFGRDYFVKIVL